MKFTATKNAFAGIHGSTIINHKIRVKLDVTCSEYCILEHIYNLNKQGIKVTAYGEIDTLWESLGMRPTNFAEYVTDLIDLKYIEEANGLVVTEKWYKEFTTAYEERFEEFWNVYGIIGNKEQARKMFLKAVKEDTYDHLIQRHAIYVGHLKTCNWKGKMHCSTWLNPISKRYNDDFQAEEKEEENKEETFQL